MNTSDLVQSHHLKRQALVYVRQSSPRQVVVNLESQRLQYAMKQRAVELGWHERDVEVIDADLGLTAATTDGRTGFNDLVARVALGKVGIIIAYDATRLARNCSHWYQLLDLCGHSGCLIADRDGVYDPASINGRLLLGLKGQISELELHTLRARLTAGIQSKARRGALAQKLPAGLVRLETGQVVKDPDLEVQKRLELVFETMLQKRSAHRVARFLRQHDLKLPRRDDGGGTQWRPATSAAVYCILRNPAYAGAFVHGRTGRRKCQKSGKNRQFRRLPEQWNVCLQDRYPTYLSWDTFEKIQSMLHDNYAEYQRRTSPGIPREGQALLQGLVYCGQCGHKLAVRYRRGARYICHFLYQHHAQPVCQKLQAEAIDQQVVDWFWRALSMAEINLSVTALAEADRERERVRQARRQEVERLRYQSRLAERQYQHTDPENRLVAAEIERRWEEALRELKAAEEKLRADEEGAVPWAIPADLVEMLKNFGSRLPELWEQRLFTTAQKKALLRALIDKVVVRRVAPDRIHVRVVWCGADTTEGEVRVRVGRLADLSEATSLEEEIVRLARAGHSDDEIAEQLTSQGFRSAKKPIVPLSTVRTVRLARRVMDDDKSHPCRRAGFLSLTQLAEKLGVSRDWLYYRINKGVIRPTRQAHPRFYLFPDKPETLRQFRRLLHGEISHVEC
jgi:DNA invertase Pin-like site-specific DNA recombinase/predicted DNA-binding transcriptional regulator AlpA